MSRIFFTALWIQLCWGFVCTDLITALEPTWSYVELLCDFVYIVLGVVTIKSRRDVMVTVSFFIIATLSAYLNHQGSIEFINGCRDFIGLLFAVPIIRYFLKSRDSEQFVESFDKFLYLFLWLQVPCLLSQFIRFGAGDEGGGSLGANASGRVSTLIYVISYYLINKRWNESESYFNNLWANRVYIFLLFPSFLNETKISIVYFIFYFILLIRIDRKIIIRFMLTLPVSIILFIVAGYFYLSFSNIEGDRFDLEYFNDYFIGDDMEELIELAELVQDEVIETDNLWVVDLPRYGRFMVMPEILNSATGGGLMLGAGVGQFKGGQVLSLTGFSAKYRWFLQGSSIMIFFIVVQLGIFGLVWLLYDLISLLFTPDFHARAYNLRLYMIMVTVMTLVYNSQYRSFYMCVILFYISLRGLQPYLKDRNK